MRYVKRFKPSGSMIVAIIALVVACAGTAVAAVTITGKDIANNTVASKKITNKTLKKQDLSKKLFKQINKGGPAGSDGSNGTNGTDGTDGTDGVDGGNGSKIGTIGFERDGYVAGTIGGQNGWLKTGAFDVAVASVSGFPAASGYGFGEQALRISDSVTSGSFGDQTYSPGLPDEAGESDSNGGGYGSGDIQPHFETTFKVGSTLTAEQTGMHMTVSPDNGGGSRVSYLRFDDMSDGIHVFFDDVTGGTTPDFAETDIATINRTSAHTIGLSIDFVDGPSNDVVKVFVDGALEITGTTWEDYYRYDPEQAGNNNLVPSVDKLLFREGGAAHPANAGNGFLVDGVKLSSSTP